MGTEFDVYRIEHLAHGFVNQYPFDVIWQVFHEFSQSRLNEMGPEEITAIVQQLNKREDVISLQKALDEEVNGHGQEGLERVASGMVQHLPIPTGAKIEVQKLDEIVGICNSCQKEFVTGNFERDSSNQRFRPENIFYAENLAALFSRGALIHPDCVGSDISQRKVASVLVYRNGNKGNLTEIVKKVIDETAGLVVSSGNRRYSQMENYLVDQLGKVFRLHNPNGTVNYSKLYDVFEWIFRQNINLRQFFNDTVSNSLIASIGRNMVPLYGVVSSRVKTLERTFEKSVEILYESRNPFDDVRDGNAPRMLADVYGLKIMVNDLRQCYAVAASLKRMYGWIEIPNNPDNSLEIGRKRGKDGDPEYHSYDAKTRIGAAVVEVQIRTHKMDREIATSPNLRHGEAYEEEKRQRINQFPWQTRVVLKTLFGIGQLVTYE